MTQTSIDWLPGSVAEWTFICTESQESNVIVSLQHPESGEMRVPAFWRGENSWCVRVPGWAVKAHSSWKAVVTNAMECVIASGCLESTTPLPENDLEIHGAIQLNENGKHFEHADGTPIFLLADSWWFGLTVRLHWPEEFQFLVADRKAKGFSALQLTAGFPCDIPLWDARGANEMGYPLFQDSLAINPQYFEKLDERIMHVVKMGLVPILCGMWGYYLPLLGIETVRRLWLYIIDRYSAFPLIWNLCGESRLVWYLDPPEKKESNRNLQHAEWPKIAQQIKDRDVWHRPMTVHPGPAVYPDPDGRWKNPMADMSAIDFLTLQPGHSDHDALARCCEAQEKLVETYPHKAYWIGECAWEGMHGGAGPKLQRQLFWNAVLSGAAGHGYGSDALWQMNRLDDPFGKSPLGHVWGNAPWQEACQWLGATHVGIGKKILVHFPWWKMQIHSEWISSPASYNHPMGNRAAGVPREFRLHYFPLCVPPWSKHTLLGLEPDISYTATWWSPINGTCHPIGSIHADESGCWSVPFAPVLHDWILALENVHPTPPC